MRMTVGKKLLSGFMLVAVLLLVVAYLGISTINKIDNDYNKIIKVNLRIDTDISDMKASQLEKAAAVRGYMVYRDNKYIQSYDDASKVEDQSYNDVAKLITTDQAKQYLK